MRLCPVHFIIYYPQLCISGNRFAGFRQTEVCFDGVGSQVRRVSGALKDGMQPFTVTHYYMYMYMYM